MVALEIDTEMEMILRASIGGCEKLFAKILSENP